MTIYHYHHITPKHAGGSDDPNNLIKMTVEEHAEAHKNLYDQYGRPQDFAAWKGLSGMIDKSEIIRYIQSECSKIKNKKEIENRTHPFLGDRNPSRKKVKEGTHHFQQNIGNRPGDIAQRELVEKGLHHWQTERHAEDVGARSRKLIKLKKHPFGEMVKCPNCNKEGQKSAMKRWHFDNCTSVSF
jgi:hypothetical protein